MDGSGAPEAAQGAEVRATGAGSDVNAEERTSTPVAVCRVLQQDLDDSRDLSRLREEAHADRQPGAPTTAFNTKVEDARVGRGRSVQCGLRSGHAAEPSGRTAQPDRIPQGRAECGKADWRRRSSNITQSWSAQIHHKGVSTKQTSCPVDEAADNLLAVGTRVRIVSERFLWRREAPLPTCQGRLQQA